MTGYKEAEDWLNANAPEWRLVRGEASLVAGLAQGDPTAVRIRVELVHAVRMIESGGRDQVTLEGEGDSYLVAVQNAVGGLVDAAERIGRA